MKRIKYILAAMLAYITGSSQEANPGMADALRGNGKIYVVVAVLVTIFAGIILNLIRLERKITRLEKDK